MAIFPTLQPGSRAITPGSYPGATFRTLSGRDSRVRHSNAVVGMQAKVVFVLLNETELESIRSHYLGQQGGHQSFAVPDEFWSGANAPAGFTPAGYQWRYASKPSIEEITIDTSSTAATLFNVSIELEAVPGSAVVLSGATYNIKTTWLPGYKSFAANGATWDVTVSWLPGSSSIWGPFVDPYFSSVSLLLSMDGLNGSTTIVDTSVNNVTLTSVNGAALTTAQSKFGGSAFNTGAAIGVAFTAASGTNFAFPADFTVECWAYFTANNVGYQGILGTYSTGDQTAWVLAIEANNTYAFYGSSGSGWGLAVNSSATPTLNAWHHIAVTRSGSTVHFFVNGVQIASQTSTLSITSGTTIEVGNYLHSPIGRRAFSGYLDEVRITKGIARYTSAFTPPTTPFPTTQATEIVPSGLTLHLDAGNAASYSGTGTTWTDLSGNGNNGTLVNGVGYSSANGGSLVFDGANDYASTSFLPSYSAITFSAWINASSLALSEGIGSRILHCSDGSGNQEVNLIIVNNAIRWSGYGSSAYAWSINSSTIQTGIWYNLVGTYGGSQATLYINGTQVSTAATTVAMGSPTVGLVIGRVGYTALGNYLGQIAAVATYSRALTPAEITQNFNALRGRFGV